MNDKINWRRLKTAAKKLISEFGGLEQAAACCRVNKSNLSLYQSFDNTAMMPIDVVAELQEVSGTTHVTSVLQDMDDECGATLDHLPVSVESALLDYEAGTNEVFSKVMEALHIDGPSGRDITENERRDIFAAIAEADMRKAKLMKIVHADPLPIAAE